MPTPTSLLSAAALCALATGAAAAASAFGGPERTAGTYTLHRHSAAHARPAAWARTLCGNSAHAPQPDIPTQWGAAVTPDNVLPEYPRPQMTRDAATTVTNMK
jgi:hypothetical protein